MNGTSAGEVASTIMRTLLFVHSPLVGPSTWTSSAELMRSHGFDVRVPDLTGVAQAPPPRWKAFVRAAAEAADMLGVEVAVVGHSGAGAFLPAIADRLEGHAAPLVFVDAVIPPPGGVHETPARMHALLDEQTIDGHLRRWLEWWPDDVVDDLVPDVEERAALLAEMPSLPRSFYDEAIPIPDGWMERRCAYVKLSDAYDAEYAEAGRLGWKRTELDADHLAICTQPDRVIGAIESVINPDA